MPDERTASRRGHAKCIKDLHDFQDVLLLSSNCRALLAKVVLVDAALDGGKRDQFMALKYQAVRVAYNGIPLKEGEVLVPRVVDEDFLRTNDVKGKDVRIWEMAGVSYSVVFYAVPAKDAFMAMSQYYSVVNDLLDQKFGRNRSSKSELEFVSLEGLLEKNDEIFASCDDTEAEALFFAELDDLMEELEDEDVRAFIALCCLANNPDRAEAINDFQDSIGVGKSQAYVAMKKARNKLNEYFDD